MIGTLRSVLRVATTLTYATLGALVGVVAAVLGVKLVHAVGVEPTALPEMLLTAGAAGGAAVASALGYLRQQ